VPGCPGDERGSADEAQESGTPNDQGLLDKVRIATL
jgi:hypothetical protein